MTSTEHDYDVLVIGSGFGGSVTALRLTEKGYRVGVIEAGARFEDSDFAATSFDTRRYLFRPELACYGIQRIDALKPTPSTSRSSSSTTTRPGRTSPTGVPSSAPTTTRRSGCSASPTTRG
jgi:choline dehydrogenase-like flavoprotein